jgi:hypothetical protein
VMSTVLVIGPSSVGTTHDKLRALLTQHTNFA